MSQSPHGMPAAGRSWVRKLLDAGIVLLIIFGFVSAITVVLHTGPSSLPLPGTSSSSPGESQPANNNLALPSSTPVSLAIPSVKVTSDLTQVGLNADGSPGIPTGANVDKAAWLNSSVTPGEIGTSVIIGHVDTVKSGPSVFYKLGSLAAGDKIYIHRQDGRTAVFSVNSVQAYDKKSFPSATVYGMSGSPVLRLITCTGTWDATAHSYTENLVVFASLSAVQ